MILERKRERKGKREMTLYVIKRAQILLSGGIRLRVLIVKSETVSFQSLDW